MATKDILKNRRKELNLSQKDVANYVGVSEATVSRWESGNIANMGRDKIALLSQILRISPSVIAGYDDTDEETFTLTNIEKELVTAYRNKPEMQEAVNTLLGINKPAAITNDSVVQDINLLSKANQQTTIEKK